MKQCYQETADVFRALAHPIRLEIIEALSTGECPVCQLQIRVGCRQPNISQHLRILRHMRLVERRKQGLYVYYRLSNTACVEALLKTLSLPIPGVTNKPFMTNLPIRLSKRKEG